MGHGRQRAERLGLVAKTLRRRNAGRAVFTPIGNIACPPIQICLKSRPALEPAAGDRVLLDVADPGSSFPIVRAR